MSSSAGFSSVKNLILNVSAVVWRRDALLRALDRCEEDLRTFRMAGDWRLYLEVLAEPGARVAYEATPLNVHRRHAESVTHALRADRHIAEIERDPGTGGTDLRPAEEDPAGAADLPRRGHRAAQGTAPIRHGNWVKRHCVHQTGQSVPGGLTDAVISQQSAVHQPDHLVNQT